MCNASPLRLPRRGLFKPSKAEVIRPKHKADKVPEEFECVYSKFHKFYQYGAASTIVLTTIGVAGGLGVIMYNLNASGFFSHGEYVRPPQQIISDQFRPIDPIQVSCILLGVTLSLAFVIMFVTNGIIYRLYYNHEKNVYIAVFLRYCCQKKKIEIKPGEVTNAPRKELRGHHMLNGSYVMIDEFGFSDNKHYNNFLGYYKVKEDMPAHSQAYAGMPGRTQVLKKMKT